MQVTIHFTDGETGKFTHIDELETVNDIAYLDGVMHTDVEDVEVTA